MSTLPRLLLFADLRLGSSSSAGGKSAGAGGSPSLDKAAKGLCPKLGPPSVGIRLDPLMSSFSERVRSSGGSTGEPSGKTAAGSAAVQGENVSGQGQPLGMGPGRCVDGLTEALQEVRVAGAAVGFGFFGFFVSFL
jgi:hypothetical protein